MIFRDLMQPEQFYNGMSIYHNMDAIVGDIIVFPTGMYAYPVWVHRIHSEYSAYGLAALLPTEARCIDKPTLGYYKRLICNDVIRIYPANLPKLRKNYSYV